MMPILLFSIEMIALKARRWDFDISDHFARFLSGVPIKSPFDEGPMILRHFIRRLNFKVGAAYSGLLTALFTFELRADASNLKPAAACWMLSTSLEELLFSPHIYELSRVLVSRTMPISLSKWSFLATPLDTIHIAEQKVKYSLHFSWFSWWGLQAYGTGMRFDWCLIKLPTSHDCLPLPSSLQLLPASTNYMP